MVVISSEDDTVEGLRYAIDIHIFISDLARIVPIIDHKSWYYQEDRYVFYQESIALSKNMIFKITENIFYPINYQIVGNAKVQIERHSKDACYNFHVDTPILAWLLS